jgi:DNA-binding transcriptional MerR regulator
MEYSIKQVAIRTKLTDHTLRYYDREGLMPLLKRSSSGQRLYTENDICWIELICCLKNSGMPLSQIKEFMNLCLQGEETCEERKVLLENHKKEILSQLDFLNHSLDTINYKLDNYKEIGIFHIDCPSCE